MSPHERAIAWPVRMNTSVMIDAEGTPFCSNTMLSSTLPELHDPQSPTPATTMSQADLNSATISGDGGMPALRLRRMT